MEILIFHCGVHKKFCCVVKYKTTNPKTSKLYFSLTFSLTFTGRWACFKLPF